MSEQFSVRPFTSSSYFVFFCFFFQCSASEIFSAHGTVSSNKMTCFFSIFHENLFSSSPLLLVIFLYLYLLSFRLNTSEALPAPHYISKFNVISKTKRMPTKYVLGFHSSLTYTNHFLIFSISLN